MICNKKEVFLWKLSCMLGKDNETESQNNGIGLGIEK